VTPTGCWASSHRIVIALIDGGRHRHVSLAHPEQEPQRFIGVIEDISSRKRAEAALQEETRALELLNDTGNTLGATARTAGGGSGGYGCRAAIERCAICGVPVQRPGRAE